MHSRGGWPFAAHGEEATKRVHRTLNQWLGDQSIRTDDVIVSAAWRYAAICCRFLGGCRPFAEVFSGAGEAATTAVCADQGRHV